MWLWGVYERVQMYVRGMCVQAYANAGEEVCLCNCGVFKCRYSCVGMQVYVEMCAHVNSWVRVCVLLWVLDECLLLCLGCWRKVVSGPV